MKNFSETKNKITGECFYLEDKKDAQKIAALLKLPLKILDFEKEYGKYVIDPMFKSYAKGYTPNPDSLCNKIIKFPLLWKEAKKLKADYIATGHYIKKIYNKKTKQYQLKIPKDKAKDQSYFLYELTQFDLKHCLFPIHNITKAEVRKIAKKHNFPNYNKKSTRGICFVGKTNMKGFLQSKIAQKKGKIIDTKGNIIGEHNGIMFYTIGERVKDKEMWINNIYRNKMKKKIYVAGKNKRKNELIVAPENHLSLYKNQFLIKKVNWIGKKPKMPLTCKVRIRHLGKLEQAIIRKAKNEKKIVCILGKAIKGIADGQSAVIYKNNIVLGGGEIRF